MIKQTIKLGVATIASVGLMGGMAFAAPSISNTGKKSVNVVSSANVNLCKQVNKNNVNANNVNVQGARSGKASVKGNTGGGTAVSGKSSNTNDTTADLTISNPSSDSKCVNSVTPLVGDGSIDTTGNRSVNVVSNFSLNAQKTVNVNNVCVSNVNVQGASTGSATVSGNTTGGDATSGDATNSNTTSITLSVSNN